MLPLFLLLAQNVVPSCNCNPARPETMQSRSCSLSLEADRQPPNVHVFFVKDINPRKPNRTLAMLTKHGPERYTLDDLTAPERTELWTAAIAKARELWGEDWAVAYNGDKVRTQCHPHIHIGMLNDAAKQEKYLLVDSPAGIPPPRGSGIWIYGQGQKLRVHTGEQITETALVR